MRWWLSLGLVAVARLAHADGPLPDVRSITVRQGMPDHAVAAMREGIAVTHDGGATWRWMCSAAVGYAGSYVPDYAYTSSGALFATTFNGLKVNRDGCTFAATALGTKFVSQAELAASGALHAAASDPTDSQQHRSVDDGVTFPTSTQAGVAGDYWGGLLVAPSDGQRVYLVGFRFDQNNAKVYSAFASTNGGTSFGSISTGGISLTQLSVLTLAGISATNPDVVFAREADGGAVYRSSNGGQSWTLLSGIPGTTAFIARANGSLVAADGTAAWVSTDNGDSWTPLASPPHMSCFAERPNGELWACTSAQLDGSSIMKTTDLAAWSSVLRFRDMAGPVQCAAGTVQHDTCATAWCSQLAAQFGAQPCPSVPDGAPPDAGVDSGTGDGGGCCDAGSGALQLALVAPAVALLLRRRRRR